MIMIIPTDKIMIIVVIITTIIMIVTEKITAQETLCSVMQTLECNRRLKVN